VTQDSDPRLWMQLVLRVLSAAAGDAVIGETSAAASPAKDIHDFNIALLLNGSERRAGVPKRCAGRGPLAVRSQVARPMPGRAVSSWDGSGRHGG